MLEDSIGDMDEKLREVIEKKIDAVFARTDEIKKTIESLDELAIKTDAFSFGIIIGRYTTHFIINADDYCNEILQNKNFLNF